MNWQTVRVIFGNEVRMLLRDRRTIFVAIILPLAIYPLMFYATKTTTERREKNLAATVYQYAVAGSQAEQVRDLITRGSESTAREAAAGKSEKDSLADFKFHEVDVKDPAASLKGGEIHFYLEGLSGKEADALPRKAGPPIGDPAAGPAQSKEPGQVSPPPARLPGVPLILIYFQGDRDASQAGSSKMRDFLSRTRRLERDALLRQRGLQVNPDQVMSTGGTDVASAGQVTGSYVGRFLTLFVLIFLLSAGSIVAMDSIAGEKERGSLETLLTTAARRGEIVAAKQFLIVAVALIVTLIQMANLLAYVTFKIIKLPQNWTIEAPPATIVTLLLLFVPMAAFTASILLMISAYAKTYKEAQLYFFPVYLVSMVPALAGVLPGVTLRSAIVLVPVANVSVAVREIMVGKFDWPMIATVFVVMTLAAAWAVRASANMLSKESLITASEADAADFAGGSVLFPKHVLRWYAVMAVVLFAVALNVPQLATFRAQVLFNELVIFLGAPLLMARKYRLNMREALALRPVNPIVWLGVLLAIPSGLIVATGVFRLANLIFPVPQRALEQFGRDIMPKDVPLWQLVLLISILPAICEEIAFRGTLLYGLRRKFRPVALALAVGLIFGLFHVALFRILPTAFLGVILTAIALLTGSIFPGMLMHAGNNALSLWLAESGIFLARLTWGWYLAAAATFALAFFILYRARTPYPDLRPGVRRKTD
ncbi:MAG: ABC transporter permease subunit [Acidobacteriia bacterium]|nr:ABC transporter permease subunit [Terriglobia bacterium]